MVNQYRINIINQMQGRPSQFLLFQEKPTNDASHHVIASTPRMDGSSDDSSRATFMTNDEYYAVFGESRGSRISISSFKKVKLGPGGSVVALTNKDGFFAWDNHSASGRQSESSGSFELITDSFFSQNDPSNVNIGVGVHDPTDESDVVPIATFRASPGTTYQFFPKPVYYIASGGGREQGGMVEMNSMGSVVKVDFTQATNKTADIVFISNSSFTDHNGKSAANRVTITPQ